MRRRWPATGTVTLWPRRWSPRARLAGTGLAVLAAALLVGALLVYLVTTLALSRSVDAGARTGAQRVAELATAGRLPEVLPATPPQIIQVLDAEGRVLAASVTGDRVTALVSQAERARLRAGEVVVVPGSRAALGGELRVVGLPADDPAGGELLVVAATPTADVDITRGVLRRLLVVLVPVALAALAVLAWRMTGSALRPVAQARRSQREFVADAAHELRSPLASMRTQLEVAQRLGEGGRLPGDLLAEVDRLSALVEDLLILARTDAGPGAPPEAVDLTELLDDVARRRPDARVPITVRCPPGLTAQAVADDLQRAVDNLVDNALRHAVGRVEVEAEAMGDAVEIRVRDDGAGIAAQDRERVFERFARLDEARDRDRGGTGLGLPIAQELVRRGGGQITLTDAGPGLCAVIRLPLSAARNR